jgi:hypothetical protein
MSTKKSYAKIREEDIFYPLPGYPGYEINHMATIQRIYKKTRRVLKPILKRGLLVISLHRMDGKRKQERVHKLMELAFLPIAPPNHVLYHKNGNRIDNYIKNLKHIDRVELGKLTGAMNGSRRAVAKINRAGIVVATYTSARKAGKANFLSYQTVLDRCNGVILKPFNADDHNYVWNKDLSYS